LTKLQDKSIIYSCNLDIEWSIGMNIQEVRDSAKVLKELIRAYNKVNKAINKLHSVNAKVSLNHKNWFTKIIWKYIKPNLLLKSKKIGPHKELKLEILNQLSKDLYIMISRVEACESYDKSKVYILIKIASEYT